MCSLAIMIRIKSEQFTKLKPSSHTLSLSLLRPHLPHSMTTLAAKPTGQLHNVRITPQVTDKRMILTCTRSVPWGEYCVYEAGSRMRQGAVQTVGPHGNSVSDCSFTTPSLGLPDILYTVQTVSLRSPDSAPPFSTLSNYTHSLWLVESHTVNIIDKISWKYSKKGCKWLTQRN